MHRARRNALLAATVVLAAAIPNLAGSSSASTADGGAAPSRPAPPRGSSTMVATAFGGPFSTPYSYNSTDVAHAGDYENQQQGASVGNDGSGTITTATVQIAQSDTLSATEVTSTGGTTASASPGGAVTARNDATTTFTVPVSSRWKVTATASTTGPACIPGFVSVGDTDQDPFFYEQISCDPPPAVPTLDLTRYVDLLRGHRYFYVVGHESSDVANSSFSWDLTLEQAPGPVRNVMGKPVVKRVGTTSRYTATKGSWTGFPSTFAYQWLRNGTKIVGATKQTYTVRGADKGTKLSVKVTATGPGGRKGTATSKAVRVPG